MYTTILIDDENPARLRLRKLLEAHTQVIQIIGEADCGQAAIQQIETLRPQLLFLDIQLPDMNGFDVLKNLTYRPLVIFSTAYEQYALKAFESFSIDYLVKPFDADRFAKAIRKLEKLGQNQPTKDFQELEKLVQELKPKQKSFALPVKIGERILLIDYNDITYFQAEDKYTRVFTKSGKKYLGDWTLTQLEKDLPAHFLRVQRSFIVNKKSIVEMRKYFKGKLILVLNDTQQSTVTTGTTYSERVKKELGLL